MTKNRKVLLAGGTSLLLILVAVGVIAVFGYTPPPTFESLRKHPDSSITGMLAYVDDDKDGKSCLHVIRASGDGKDLQHCDPTYYTAPMFTRDGDVVMSSSDPVAYNKTKYEVFDPETLRSKETFSVVRNSGDELSQSYGDDALFTSDNHFDDYGSGIFNAHNSTHTVWVARDIDGKNRIFSRKAPADYDFISAAHSPDNKWIVVSSTRGDVLISDDNGHVRELMRGHSDSSSGGLFGGSADFGFYSLHSVAWYQSGHSDGTVDVAKLKSGSGNGPSADSDASRSYTTTMPL